MSKDFRNLPGTPYIGNPQSQPVALQAPIREAPKSVLLNFNWADYGVEPSKFTPVRKTLLYFASSTGAFTVPLDYSDKGAELHAIGAGAGALNATIGGNTARSGAGGAYAFLAEPGLIAGQTAFLNVPTGGIVPGGAGGDAWLNRFSNVPPGDVNQGILAKGATNAVGGQAAACIGDYAFSGGNTNNSGGLGRGATGAGSAAGPHGPGRDGSPGSNPNNAGCGGAGADGLLSTSGSVNPGVNGGAGGAGPTGILGGAGGVVGVAGGNGSPAPANSGAGGGGGANTVIAGKAGSGGGGARWPLWQDSINPSNIVGPGGGAGGGGAASGGVGFIGGDGGGTNTGGQRGNGGAAGGPANAGGAIGTSQVGADGLVVLLYYSTTETVTSYGVRVPISLEQGNVKPLERIVTLYVDNSQSNVTVYVRFYDTLQTIVAPAGACIYESVTSNNLNFDVFADGFTNFIDQPQTQIIVSNRYVSPQTDYEQQQVRPQYLGSVYPNNPVLNQQKYRALAVGDLMYANWIEVDSSATANGISITFVAPITLPGYYIYLTDISIFVQSQIPATGGPPLEGCYLALFDSSKTLDYRIPYIHTGQGIFELLTLKNAQIKVPAGNPITFRREPLTFNSGTAVPLPPQYIIAHVVFNYSIVQEITSEA